MQLWLWDSRSRTRLNGFFWWGGLGYPGFPAMHAHLIISTPILPRLISRDRPIRASGALRLATPVSASPFTPLPFTFGVDNERYGYTKHSCIPAPLPRYIAHDTCRDSFLTAAQLSTRKRRLSSPCPLASFERRPPKANARLHTSRQ